MHQHNISQPFNINPSIEFYDLLQKMHHDFKSHFNLLPIVGAEIEFYIHSNINIHSLETAIGHMIHKEKGRGQYEISLLPSSNIAYYALYIAQLRKNIMRHTELLGGRADFSPKPFDDDYGNSLHIHLNFVPNVVRADLAYRKSNNDITIEQYAQILCYYLPQTIEYFLPRREDYKRLDAQFMAPTHISYGNNNRTVMIRIPDATPKRIEHRLASANVDPIALIYILLKSIKNGLHNIHIIPQMPKIYGNASDPQYALIKIS